MRSRSQKYCTPTGRRGIAAVEFAVVAPMFVLLLAGIMEFGQAFRIEHMLSSASRRGARTAVINGSTTTQVVQKVKSQCVETLGVKDTDVSVEVTVNGNTTTDLSKAKGGDEIDLTVSILYSKAGVGFFASMFASSTLSSTCTFEHE